MRQARSTKVFWALLLLLCLFQAHKLIDFQGYYFEAERFRQLHFAAPNYQTERGAQGAYYQSPLLTLFFVPFSFLSLHMAKALWALLMVAGLVYLWRLYGVNRLDLKQSFFLALVFAHPLSDVFLSGNVNFLLQFLLSVGWIGLDSKKMSRFVLGACCMALAIHIKIVPILFVGFYLLIKEWRKAFAVCVAGVAGILLTIPVLGSATYTWWKSWIIALKFYPEAVGPGRLSFQSPPAALFRYLSQLSSLSFAERLQCASLLGSALMLVLVALAVWLWRRQQRASVFAFLLAALFVGGPFSWALTVLYLLPLLVIEAQRGLLPVAWVAAIVLALIPKALWPEALWNPIAFWSLPAFCLMVLTASATYRQSNS